MQAERRRLAGIARQPGRAQRSSAPALSSRGPSRLVHGQDQPTPLPASPLQARASPRCMARHLPATPSTFCETLRSRACRPRTSSSQTSTSGRRPTATTRFCGKVLDPATPSPHRTHPPLQRLQRLQRRPHDSSPTGAAFLRQRKLAMVLPAFEYNAGHADYASPASRAALARALSPARQPPTVPPPPPSPPGLRAQDLPDTFAALRDCVSGAQDPKRTSPPRCSTFKAHSAGPAPLAHPRATAFECRPPPRHTRTPTSPPTTRAGGGRRGLRSSLASSRCDTSRTWCATPAPEPLEPLVAC